MTAGLRVGIIGAGFGARVHLPALRSVPGVTVAALADSGSGRAGAFADGETEAMAHWRDLVGRSDLQAVVVAVPPAAQREMVEAALAAGKHVLCEKPFGAHGADADALVAAVTRAGTVGAVGFQFRFEPHLQALQREIRAGRIGAVSAISIDWFTAGRADPSVAWSWQNDSRAGGGVINAFASHGLDLMSWLSGAALGAVGAVRTHIVVPERPDTEGRKRPVTAEDWLEAELALAGGIAARLAVSNCRPGGDGMTVRVTGALGSLTCRQRPPFRPEDASLVFEERDVPPLSLAWPLPRVPSGDSRLIAAGGLAQAFAAAIRGEAVDYPDFAAGSMTRHVLDILRQFPLSQRQGSPI